MNSSLARTIRDVAAPRSVLSVNAFTWRGVLSELRLRGGGRRESGAFFLGHDEGPRRLIRKVLYYDDLDPRALDTGGILLDGRAYAHVFDECERLSMRVVADVHTHPVGSAQSPIDRQHPMIREPGHVALIIPSFAALGDRGTGVYQYRGNGAWIALSQNHFYRGWFG